ncbi:insulinase family protein [Streptomyces sp. NPDC085927]|uniref:insulinase family protein n=1 Tax=Streptomyces sp. NPDC085927 TaxID=3365738 RepID=UPI0037D45FAF
MNVERPEFRDVDLDSGIRVVVVTDDRVPLVEVRLRTPNHGVTPAVIQRFSASGSQGYLSPQAIISGYWLDVQASALAHWNGRLLRTLSGVLGAGLVPDSVLVIVGSVDLDKAVADAASAFEGSPRRPKAPSAVGPPGVFAVDVTGGNVALRTAEAPPGSCVSEAARTVATAIIGGHEESRLGRRFRRTATQVYRLDAARDALRGAPEFVVRAVTSPDSANEGLHQVMEEIRNTQTGILEQEEINTAATLVRGQLLSIFDSQSTLADRLIRTIAMGRAPEDMWHLPEAITGVGIGDVTSAFHELLGRSIDELRCTTHE